MEFQPEKESWQSYAERLDHFFSANKVEDDQKVTALIIANDPSFYTLLKELSFPINPKTMTFYEVMDTLERHYVGVKNIFRARKLFYSAKLEQNESASEWYRRLKSLAIDCEFGVLLEEILVDKFVCGFEGKILQSFYVQDESLDLLNALKIAQLHEIDVDNESIYEVESDFSEDRDDQESESDRESEHEDQDYDQSRTLEPQEIDTRQKDEAMQGSMQSQELLMLQQQICFQRHLLNDMFLSQSQQQLQRTRRHKVSQGHHHGVSRQKQKPQEKQVNKPQKQVQQQGNHQKQETPKQQKPPQPQKQQKPAQKQNNQPHKPNEQVKSQHKPSNHKPISSQKPPISQKQSQHQSSNHKPSSSQKSPMPQKQQPVRKLTNQQKPLAQMSQTVQKSTTVITKTKTTIKTATTTATSTNPKKGPTKCHKCGKVGHNANVCSSKKV